LPEYNNVMADKKITIEKLALMVQGGFNGVDKRLDGVDKRLDGVDKRLDKIEKDVSEIKILVKDDQRRRIEKLEMRVDYLENTLNLPSKK